MSTHLGQAPATVATRLAQLQARIDAIRGRMGVPSAPSAGSAFAAHLGAAEAGSTSGIVMADVVMPVDGPIRSGWGPRTDPVDGTRRFHHGIDIAAPMGSPVVPMSEGRVVFAGEKGGYGLLVEVEHPDGSRARYAHLSRIDVAVGDLVVPRRPLGAVGSTGRSTGPHLHLELRIGGESVDPMTRLRPHGPEGDR